MAKPMNDHVFKRLMQLVAESKKSGDKTALNAAFVKLGVSPIDLTVEAERREKLKGEGK